MFRDQVPPDSQPGRIRTTLTGALARVPKAGLASLAEDRRREIRRCDEVIHSLSLSRRT